MTITVAGEGYIWQQTHSWGGKWCGHPGWKDGWKKTNICKL